MEGYDVITTEDEKVGKVVGTQAEFLIVEQGTLRKSKHALPRAFYEVDDAEGVVRMSAGKDIFCDSPKIEDGELDQQAILEHYGLAGGSEAPPTEGYGVTDAQDPARGSEQQAERAGITPGPQERAETREQLAAGENQGIEGESPALLGDRLKHTRD
jgi:hypothetical protein